MELTNRSKLWQGLAALSLALPIAAAVGAANAEDAKPAAPIIEQSALDMLKVMSDKLAAAKSLTVDVRDLREVPTDQGQMLTLLNTANVTIERPNKLRVEDTMGSVDTLFVYDGKKLSVLDIPKNVYATADAPATIDEFLDFAAKEHGINFAMADFLTSDPYAGLTKGLTNAYEAPSSPIDGLETHHLVFAAPGIEWQLWLDATNGLPRLFTVTYLDRPRQPHFVAEFKNWDLNTPTDDAFAFTPPKDAVPIKFLPNE